MNRLGIQSLNAGAPDLRLTGDQTQRGTYTQRRRNQMAYGGIAGLDGRKRYGIGSWFQEKIMDPIKENPEIAALVGGAALNQWGLPNIPGMEHIGLEKGSGQNWLGELLGKIPGVPDDLDLVFGDTVAEKARNLEMLGKAAGSTGMIPGAQHGDVPGEAKQQVLTDLLNKAREPSFLTKLGQTIVPGGQTGFFDLYGTGGGGGLENIKPDASGRYPINWRGPLTIGTGIGLADYLTRSDDTMPAQLAIDPSRFATAEAAKADPLLRFKPQEQYTLKDGGRIGYRFGGNGNGDDPGHEGEPLIIPDDADIHPDDYWGKGRGIEGQMAGGEYNRAMELMLKLKENIPLTDEEKEELKGLMQTLLLAKGGRVAAQEGGLMDLGGMEKDYRQEGGFVPIGAREKADDVPARLSKNEFVFTADAVRSAGGGDIDEGAQVMENLMEHLEAGGKVSEDSQGLEGAQAMFANTQKLQNRII